MYFAGRHCGRRRRMGPLPCTPFSHLPFYSLTVPLHQMKSTIRAAREVHDLQVMMSCLP